MRNQEIEGSDDDDMASSARQGGGSYGPVVAHDNDPVVLEMSSIDPGSSSSLKLVFLLFMFSSSPSVFLTFIYYLEQSRVGLEKLRNKKEENQQIEVV